MCITKNIKLVYFVIITTCLIVIYILLNTKTPKNQSNTATSFKVLNTSDIVKLLRDKHTANYNNSTLFGLDVKQKLTPKPCDPSIKLIIIITSHFHNVETRSAMRRAFNSTTLQTLNTKRIFLLGSVTQDTQITQSSLENESTRFNDILQGNFMEAYRNLTYKHMMGLKWAGDHCSKAQYIIKMDDDIVIDLKRIVKYLLVDNQVKFPKKLLAGYVLKNMTPKREPANKWFVTQQEYSEDTYPTFLSGWFYVTNPETAKLLFWMSTKHEYFWIDDTLITGVFAQLLRIKHFNLSQYYTVHTEFIWCCIDDYKKYGFECPYFVGPNGGDANLFIEFNEAVGKCNDGDCVMRNKSINETCIGTDRTKIGDGKSSFIKPYKLF